MTDQHIEKLDADLRQLVQTGEIRPNVYDYLDRMDGTREFNVVLRTSDPERIRDLVPNVRTVVGQIATARLSIPEIKEAAKLEIIYAIENASPVYPQEM